MKSMGSCSAGVGANPLYALVSYIPGNLGTYLNRLRHDLVSTCSLLSHLTFLPPRHLAADPEALSRELNRKLIGIESFPVVLGEVEIFESTNVVYIGLEQGSHMVRQIHTGLAGGLFTYDEPFPFHPHITLAQEFEAARLPRIVDRARKAWEAIPPSSRSFFVERLVFVRNQDPNTWSTVSEHDLSGVPLVRTA
jgi:2'-5' RNA ligase